MQLKCEQCGAPFKKDDLHLDRGLAVCSACGGVWKLPEQADRDTSESDNEAATATVARNGKPKGDVPIPARFTVEDNGAELLIRYRWFHPVILFLMFFAIAWDSFLVFWYSIALGGFGPPGGFGLIMILFPICHVAVGVGLTYFVIASLLNTTQLRVGEGMLSVRHGPVPWRGNVSLMTDRVQQLFCKHSVQEGRRGNSSSLEVWGIVDERQFRLLSGLTDADQALFVEQRIEKFLQIEDRPVPGEMEA